MMYSIDVIRSNTAEAVEVLADSVLNPKFNSWEVNEAIEKLKGDLKKYKDNHQNVLTEVLCHILLSAVRDDCINASSM